MPAQNKIFILKRRLLPRLWRLFGLRPASWPYLSGDTLRAKADMVFDEKQNSIRPEAIDAKTVIFVASPQFEQFAREILPQINSRFTLVTHNGDTLINEELAELGFSSGKIAKWFAMSALTKYPDLVPLPAGLENLHYYNNGVPALFDRERKNKPLKKSRILYGFSIVTNPPERQPAFDVLSNSPLTDAIGGWPGAPEYLRLLNSYKFVAAPAGNAMDSHRMWEALYLGVIPIVRRSVLMDSFRELGLPIWLIDDWSELAKLTENDLSDKYAELMATADTRALWAPYWQSRIHGG